MTRLFWKLLVLCRCFRTPALASPCGARGDPRRSSSEETESGWNCKRGLPYILRPPQHLRGRQRGKYSFGMERFLLFSFLPKYHSSLYFFIFFIYLFFFTNNRGVRPTSGASNSCIYRPDMKDLPTSHLAALVQPDSTAFTFPVCLKLNIYKSGFSSAIILSLTTQRGVCLQRERSRDREHWIRFSDMVLLHTRRRMSNSLQGLDSCTRVWFIFL